MADVFIMGDVSSAIDQWGLGYKHHVCTQESGAGATMDAEATEKRPAWVADSVSGGDIAIEEGTLRFLVRLSKPTQTEPFPKHCVDIHLTVGAADVKDVTKMSYSIETEAMMRMVVDEFGTPDIASKQWLFDRMIKQKEQFAMT